MAITNQRESSRGRSLLPREHGAYGELFVPLVAALLVGGAETPALLLAAGATLAFFAYEPVLVLTGERGPRACREVGGAALRRVALFGALALTSGMAGLFWSPVAARWGALVPLVPALGVVPLLAVRRATGRWGEFLAAISLSTVSVPVVLAGGVSTTVGVVTGLVWGLGFAVITLAVRICIDRERRVGSAPGRGLRAGLTLAVWGSVAILTHRGLLPTVALWGVTPFCVAALGLLVLFPSPRRLAAIGWTAVATSLVTAGILVTATT